MTLGTKNSAGSWPNHLVVAIRLVAACPEAAAAGRSHSQPVAVAVAGTWQSPTAAAGR